jgi:hypothetical protein
MSDQLQFSELWEKCEQYQKDKGNLDNLLQELVMKVNLYKAFTNERASEIPPDELYKVKVRTLGEILFTLTGLSLQDNINVFDALGQALQFKDPDSLKQA